MEEPRIIFLGGSMHGESVPGHSIQCNPWKIPIASTGKSLRRGAKYESYRRFRIRGGDGSVYILYIYKG